MLNWLPHNISTSGADIDWLMAVIYYLTAFVLVAMLGVLICFLYRYRQRPDRPAAFVEGHTGLEIGWTAATLVLLMGIVALSGPIWATIRQRPVMDAPESVAVRVIGKQFNWIVVYPGPDGRFDTADDLRVENDLHVPVDKEVYLILASEDVIHSFFVPHLRLKQDAVPGRDIPAWFRAVETGDFEIACAELCGFGHTTMRGWLHVLSPDDYAAWRRQRWPQDAGTPDAP